MRIARRLVFLFLRLTGIPFLLRVFLQRKRVTILCWHDPTPDVMAAHIRWLERKYNIMSLRRYMQERQQRIGAGLPPRGLIVTLDDGHKGNVALEPVFRSMREPATIFLCSAIVGTGRHFWWTEAPRDEIRILKRVPDLERMARLGACGFDEYREYGVRQALSSEEIAALKPFVEFQAHTRLHPVLPMCTDAQARDEITGCKAELEERFDLDVFSLAYPNGDYSEREIEHLRTAGFRCALTLDGGFNSLETDPYRLRRIPMSDTADINELVVKASGFWDLLMTALRTRTYGFHSRSISVARDCA